MPLVALAVPLPAGTTHARPHDGRAGQAVERTLARGHRAVPTPARQEAAGAQLAAPGSTRPLLVVVGAASLIVVLAAVATFLQLRTRLRAAT